MTEGPNEVPRRYRNTINPWMTPREIRNSVKFIERMLKKLQLSEKAESELLRLNRPDRDWSKKK